MDITSIQFPPVTKVLMTGLAVVTAGILTRVLPFGLTTLDWQRTLFRLQIWRPVTCFLYGGGGITLLFDTFTLYQTSTALENGHFGDTAAYAWQLVAMTLVLYAVNVLPFFGFIILFKSFLTMLVYLWSRQNATARISIFGLIKVPSRLYPLVLLGLDFIQEGPTALYAGVLGLLVGHFWWFITVYLPTNAELRFKRPNPVVVPRWFRQLFNTRAATSNVPASKVQRAVPASTGIAATDYRPSTEVRDAVRHRWGAGNKLGSK